MVPIVDFLVGSFITSRTTQPGTPTSSRKAIAHPPNQQGRSEQVMRALPHSSFTGRNQCARITCEPARKLPRRRPSNKPSLSGEPEKPPLHAEALVTPARHNRAPPGRVTTRRRFLR